MLVVLLGLLGAGQAGAYEGCYQPNGWCYNLWCGNGSPWNGFVGGGSIDFYIDDSFYGQAQVVGLPAATAEKIVLESLASFRAATGSVVNFRYRGHSVDLACGNSFAQATLIVMATPPNDDFAGWSSCNGGDDGCTYAGGSFGSLACSQIHFVGGAQAGHVLGADSLRKLVMHEAMHTLKFAHLSECDIDDASVVEGELTSFRWLTNADIRYLWYDYGRASADIWRRQAAPPGSYSFSAPSQIYPAGETLSPVRASTAGGRWHAVAFLEWIGSQAVTFARTVIYENNAWTAAETATPTRVFHTPALAHDYHGLPGTSRWLVASARGDAWTIPETDHTADERDVGGPTWTAQPVLAADLESPHVGADHDPISDRWVVAFVDDGNRLRLRTSSPGSGAWSAISLAPPLPGVDPELKCFGAPDVACSPVASTGLLANCLAVCLSQPRSGQVGTVWAVPFSIAGGTGVVTWGNPFDTSIGAHFGPRIAANPAPAGALQFVLLSSGLDPTSASGYFAQFDDIYISESEFVYIGPAPCRPTQ
ncbi:MAG: hypothetical protein R3F60_28955 [bacterium]